MKNTTLLHIRCIFFGAVAILLHLGCSSTQPAPEVVAGPPAIVGFEKTDLRWLLLLPEHQPSSQPPSPIVPTPKPFIHTVATPGETLMTIARWYTGDANNWRELVRFNIDLDPQRMKIGATVMIPEHILITRQSMPKKFKPFQNTPKQPQITFQSPIRITSPQLFGPIEIPRSQGMEDSALPRPLQRLDESD